MKGLKRHLMLFFVFAGLMLSLRLTSAQQIQERSQPSTTRSDTQTLQTWREFDWHLKTLCDPSLVKTPELVGEYQNVVFYPEKNAKGETGKLIIKADNRSFELVTTSGTRTGTLTATTSCGYTGLALQFNDSPNSGIVTLRAHKLGSAEGFDLESFESDKLIVLATAENQAMDFALLLCPKTYPKCWPVRRRCPCEKP